MKKKQNLNKIKVVFDEVKATEKSEKKLNAKALIKKANTDAFRFGA